MATSTVFLATSSTSPAGWTHITPTSSEPRGIPSAWAHLGRGHRLREPAEIGLTALPYDVLVHIFVLLVKDREMDAGPGPGAQRTAVRISHVSSYFRAVALSSPILWRSISLSRLDRSQFYLAKLFSSRTKECLVDIDINLRTPTLRPDRHWCSVRRFDEPAIDLRNVIDALPPSARWRSFSFTSDSGWDLQLLFSLLDRPAPELSSLHLVCAQRTMDLSDFDLFAGSAPRLSEATIGGILLSPLSHLLRDIEELSLQVGVPTQSALDECLDVVKENHRLRKFTISGEVDTRRRPSFSQPIRPPVELASLKAMSIDGFVPAAVSYFLGSINTPRLSTLFLGKLATQDYREALNSVRRSALPKVIDLPLPISPPAMRETRA